MLSFAFATPIIQYLIAVFKLLPYVALANEKERIRHILQKQVYGMAPTRIIYLIATNYILGFDEELKDSTHNFAQADAAEAAKQGKLEEMICNYFKE